MPCTQRGPRKKPTSSSRRCASLPAVANPPSFRTGQSPSRPRPSSSRLSRTRAFPRGRPLTRWLPRPGEHHRLRLQHRPRSLHGLCSRPRSTRLGPGDMMASGYNRHAGSFANHPEAVLPSTSCCAGFATRPGSPGGGGKVRRFHGEHDALIAARDASWARRTCGRCLVSEQTHSSRGEGPAYGGRGAWSAPSPAIYEIHHGPGRPRAGDLRGRASRSQAVS